MKPNILYFSAHFCVLLLLLTLSWNCAKGDTEPDLTATSKDYTGQYNDEHGKALDHTIDAQLAPSVRLPGGRKPLQVYTHQLTDRATEEQIVITRRPERGNLELFLISSQVVSSIEGSVSDYHIVAQEELKITSERFALQTQDLTGDGSIQEIFISGEDSQSNRQQVYVFQLQVSGAEKNIRGIRQIFHQEDNGSYEISFDHRGYYIVHQRLLNQANYQVELTELKWNAASRSFTVRKVETIDNNDKLSESLKAIYRGNAKDFFYATDGLWLNTDSRSNLNSPLQGRGKVNSQDVQSNANAKHKGQTFIYFDSEADEILIYADTIGLRNNDQVIEVYSISNMIKSLWNRLNIHVRNKYVANIQKSFYVTLEDIDTIRLFAPDGSSYTGTYKRINALKYQDYELQNMSDIGVADFQLEGVFTERTDGRQYSFQPEKLTLSQPDGRTWEGAYSLFSWQGKNYLELHLIEINSFEDYRRSYRIELGDSEDKSLNEEVQAEISRPDTESNTPKVKNNSGIQVLLLYPVSLLRVEEVTDTSENLIRLEREQNIDNRDLENLLPGG